MTRPRLLAVSAFLLCVTLLPPAFAGIALVVLAAVLLPATSDNPVTLRAVLPLLAFLAAQALAAARAADPAVAAGFASFLLPGVLIYLAIFLPPRAAPGHWMAIWTGFSLLTSLTICLGWVRLHMGGSLLDGEDPPEAVLRLSANWLLIVPNDASLTAILLAFPIGLLLHGARRPLRAMAVAAILLACLAMAIERSRTGLVVAGAELFIFSLLRRRILLWACGLALLLVAADQLLGLQALDKLLFANTMENHGVSGRMGLWAAAWAMFLAAPLMGHGAQSFGPGHWNYLPAWAPRYPEGHVMWAHSLYLDILAEQGLLGAAALAFFLSAPVRKLAAVWYRARNAQRANQIVAATAAASLFGFVLAAGLELTLLRRWVPIVMCGVVAFSSFFLDDYQGAECRPAFPTESD